MQLINQLIAKKLETADYHQLKKKALEEIWDFFQVYNLVCASKGIDDASDKNKIWKQFLEKQDNTTQIKLRSRMNEDRKVITGYFETLSEEEKESIVIRKFGKDTIAVDNY